MSNVDEWKAANSKRCTECERSASCSFTPKQREMLHKCGYSYLPASTPEQQAFIATSQGLGDQVEAIVKGMGLDAATRLWKKWTGKDCNCESRKKWLNDHFPNGFGGLFQ